MGGGVVGVREGYFVGEGINDTVDGAAEVEVDDTTPGGPFVEPGLLRICKLEI